MEPKTTDTSFENDIYSGDVGIRFAHPEIPERSDSISDETASWPESPGVLSVLPEVEERGSQLMEWTKEHERWVEVGIGLVAAAGAGIVASVVFPPIHKPKFLSV